MYSMLFYTILIILLLVLILRLALPFLWIFFVIYLIYYIYRLIKYRQFMKDVEKTERQFEKEWQENTQRHYYRTSDSSRRKDVIDADYTVKDDDSGKYH